ncbi:MAG TPA: sigma 54-interacting transcriptional regulator [Pyrinomonadaceae bacterium]|nr:sigma 54-interacting transcriptional regulator [Pyrinomonadaceae bacterium]
MSFDVLQIVSEINASLAASKDGRPDFHGVLETLRQNFDLRGCLLILETAGDGRLSISAAAGLAISEFRKLDAQVDHGIFRQVFEDARPISVPLAGTDIHLDLHETAQTRLLATPVVLANTPLGVLAALAADNKTVTVASEILRLAASMIAQSLRIERAVHSERQKLIDENSHLKQELKEKHDFSHMVGTSNPMKLVYDQVSQVARSNATVLLRGDSGTGKEMIANAIHYNSLRSKRPLVKLNCAALPDTLIEAELFGHEKGAFTGADRFKKGRFEMAEGGTLFLDEIGDLPLQTQIKLLRVLQEREFERLGGTQTIKTNIRLITATNKNLEEAIAKGEFREDLYYRLNVFTIFLPPLRERRSDILLLAEHFLEKYEQEHGKRIRRISTPAIDMLMAYHFPGNVRELENAIERAVLVCDSNVIHSHHLPPTLQTAEVSGTVTNLTLKSAVEAFERGLIQDTLKSTRGNIAKAARQLDSTERILAYKIRNYGIDPRRFRS